VRKRQIRTLVAFGASALALAGTASAVAPAAQAAVARPDLGGGCGSWATGDGLSVKACISASGLTVNFDGYVSGGASGSCSIVQYLVLNSKNKEVAESGRQACTDGHHIGGSYALAAGSYRNVIQFTVNGTVFAAVSPNEID
jgi:hypothetical protein